MGYGYESQAIQLDLTYQFQFVDCYKNLLTDVANPFMALAGEDALFVDSCALSSSAGPIKLQNWDIANAFEMFVIGGNAPGQLKGCFQFATWTEWAPYAAQAMLSAGAMYKN